jgi:Zn-dependent protease
MGSPLFWLRDDPQLFVAFLIAVVVGITFHEFSHAAVATLQGDDTARSRGRLTLNPISHLDPLGSIALVLAGIGWGRPVPYNPTNLRNRRFGAVMVSLAGPPTSSSPSPPWSRSVSSTPLPKQPSISRSA